MSKISLSPVTRIEGHLDFTVEIRRGKVVRARSSGTLFRGFEKMLVGKEAMDALIFTQRICGVCPTSHLNAAAIALDELYSADVPLNAYLIRNILLGLEHLYSHVAHFYLLFSPDLTNKKYSSHPEYVELKKRFSVFGGSSYLTAIMAKRKLNEAAAVLGGKFPHSQSFVPGGITFKPTSSDLVRVSCILLEVENMVTQKVLGCSVARWLANKSLANVLHWLEEKSHASSDLGLFIRIGKDFGLHKLGAGPGTFLSYGGFIQPDGKNWLKPGFFDKKLQKFDETKISEHVKYSWYEDYAGGKHPKEGETRPFYTKSRKYSFIKSPRYSGKAVEVGPLARQVINKDRLISDLAKKLGPSVYTRELARMHEAVKILQKIREWIDLVDPVKPFYKKPSKKPAGFGAGLTEAPRGALGHWVEVDKKIKRYQIITPTAWNASPADSDENPGPMEQAAISTEVTDKKNPVEVEHVIRSFDPCVGCAVHVISLK